jgi:hypothetical protein
MFAMGLNGALALMLLVVEFRPENPNHLRQIAMETTCFLKLDAAILSVPNKLGCAPYCFVPLFSLSIRHRSGPHVGQDDPRVLEAPPLAPLLEDLTILTVNTALIEDWHGILR